MDTPTQNSEPLPDVRVVVPGEPRGKGSVRSRIATARSGHQFVATYTDEQTRSYESILRSEAALAMRGRVPFNGPLRVLVCAFMSLPESWPEKKRNAALLGYHRPIVKPDWENIAKTLDAFTGIVWVDDKQIVSGLVEKYYAATPRLVVEIWQQRGPLL